MRNCHRRPRWVHVFTCSMLSMGLGLLLVGTPQTVGQEKRVKSIPVDSNWSRFRGPNGTGLIPSAKLPTEWTDDDHAWKIKLAGAGSSSPIIWGQKIFINSCDPASATISLQCIDLKNGKEIWRKKYDSTQYRMHSQNSFASSSPAVDADHVYITLASPQHTFLIALDHQGNEIWKRDFGRWVSAHGFGASPLVYKDKVIFVNSQQAQRLRRGVRPGKSRMIAVDRKTGKDKWTTDLTATTACYALPCVFSREGKPDQLICCNTGEGFYSVNPDDGSMNWTQKAFALRTVASPFLVGDLVIGSCGSGGGGSNQLVAYKPGDAGATKAFEVNRNANYVPTPVAVNGLLFSFADSGIVSCIDLKSGEIHWRQRVASGFSGSAVANSKHVYCISQKGEVIVIEAADEYKLVAKNDLGESSRATPAIVGNQLVLRTKTHLICVGKK